MKVEFKADTGEEQLMMDMILSAPEKDAGSHTLEERVAFLERHAANNILSYMLTTKTLEELSNAIHDDEEDEELEKDLENIKRSINLLHQTTLELEEYKVRLRNAENLNRQLLEKVSSLEQWKSVIGDQFNVHADELDRLNKEVFDEEPFKEEERQDD